jgi:arsenate reductase
MTGKSVLFLCTGNSCRSQMAEGWLRHVAGSDFEAASAGTDPVGLNPDAVEIMAECGIDISGHRSKHIDALRGRRFDWLITVCDRARETCPVLPGAGTTMHWSFDDPARAAGSPEERRAVFRRVRDEIRARVEDFVAEIASKEPIAPGT